SALTTLRLIGSPRNPGSPYILPCCDGSILCAAAAKASMLVMPKTMRALETAAFVFVRKFMFPPWSVFFRYGVPKMRDYFWTPFLATLTGFLEPLFALSGSAAFTGWLFISSSGDRKGFPAGFSVGFAFLEAFAVVFSDAGSPCQGSAGTGSVFTAWTGT